MLEVFPRESVVRGAAEDGERQFEETAQLLTRLLAPVPAWRQLSARVGS